MFSNVIKSIGGKTTVVKSYAMRDMGLHPEVRRERDLSFAPSHGNAPDSDSRKKIEQLMEEIGDREKYIKQMTDKTHSLEKEAYEKGFAQGERAGRELGEKRFDSAVKSFTKAAEDLHTLRETVYEKNEQQLVELVLAVARKVVHKEIETDKQILLDELRSALRYVTDREKIKVRLHPSDLEFASQHKAELTQAMEGVGKLTFEGDEGVSRGDALIESSHGIVDCGIEKHLCEVEKALRAKAGEQVHGNKKHEGAETDNDT